MQLDQNIKRNERDLVVKLAETLKPQFEAVWTHKKISASPKFRKYIKNELGYIPILQPEFDLLLRTKQGQLLAVEVKYLNMGVKGYNLPYYLGIGQTLALQRFGFDHVGLYLLAGQEINDNDLNKYGAEAWSFIRNELRLSIEYTYFRVINSGDKTRFLVMNYTGRQSGIELLDIDHPRFLITWKYPNPLKDNDTAKALRRGIELYLDGKL